MNEQTFFTLVAETLQDLEHALDEADQMQVLDLSLEPSNLIITLPTSNLYHVKAQTAQQVITIDSPFSGLHQASYHTKFKSWIVDDQRVNMHDFVFFELRQFLTS